jgi:tripartite-type tricarboxylate transporter receptor subunit TctC
MFARILGALAAMSLTISVAYADAVADFYKSKSVQLVVGYGPGGGYDVYARIVARYIGKYIPGNPTLVVVNMPGAGSLRATNFLYTTAPKDGLTIGAFARDMPLMGILGGNSNVQFDPRKFTWLGSASSSANDSYLLFARTDAEVKSIADALRPGGPALVLAGTAEGATGNDVAVLLRDTIGLNVKIITGYPDSGAIFLAVDRKEVDGRFVGLSAVSSSKADWLKPDASVRVLLQFGRAERHKLFPDAPTARELARDDRSRALIGLAELPYQLSRPMVAPPGLPPARVAALRKAFDDTMQDPAFLAEAKRLLLDVEPMKGEDIAVLVKTVLATPPEVAARVRRALDGK